MLKRTKGRLLLTLLVVTGFAGTINTTAPTKQERKFAVDLLKDSKTDLLKKIKGLSETQLSFKQSPESWSIRECFFHLALAEAGLWDKMENSMKQPASPEKRSALKFSDEELIKKIANAPATMKIVDGFQPNTANWKSINRAQAAFKFSRMQHLKYIKTTTGDLRNHFVGLPFGTIDCYQLILLVSAYNDRLNQQINEIMADPDFPKE